MARGLSLEAAATEAGIDLDEAETWAAEREKAPDRIDETLRAVALSGIQTAVEALKDVLAIKEPVKPAEDERPPTLHEIHARAATRLSAATELGRLAVALVRLAARPKPRALGGGRETGGRDLFDLADPWQD